MARCRMLLSKKNRADLYFCEAAADSQVSQDGEIESDDRGIQGTGSRGFFRPVATLTRAGNIKLFTIFSDCASGDIKTH